MSRVCTICGRRVESPFCPYDASATVERPEPPRPRRKLAPIPYSIEPLNVRRRRAPYIITYFSGAMALIGGLVASLRDESARAALVAMLVVPGLLIPFLRVILWHAENRIRHRAIAHFWARFVSWALFEIVAVIGVMYVFVGQSPRTAVGIGAALGAIFGVLFVLFNEAAYHYFPPDDAEPTGPTA